LPQKALKYRKIQKQYFCASVAIDNCFETGTLLVFIFFRISWNCLNFNIGWVLSALVLRGFFCLNETNMEKKEITFQIAVYQQLAELPEADRQLLEEARAFTDKAYAPYSHFNVGAVALLANGEKVSGSNQENAAYPVGICAERVLLSAASSLYPGVAVRTIAISYDNTKGESKHPVSPCGICRQTLVEYEQRAKAPIRLVLSGLEGEVYVLEKAGLLLPLGFSADDMAEK
jgi:cytidine deaminase